MKATSKRLLFLAAALPFAEFEPAEAQVNSYTNVNFGKWEDGSKWSAGAPTNTQTCFITNFFSKTVTVDATTVASNAINSCMTVSNLTVSAPVGSTNTLFLDRAGTGTPLRILSRLSVSNNATMLVFSNSAVQMVNASSGALVIGSGGFMNVLDGGTLNATNGTTTVGDTGTGELTVNNGSLLAGLMFIGRTGTRGTFTFAGGTARFTATSANALTIGSANNSTGRVWLVSGQVIHTNNSMFVGFSSTGVGELVVSNATLLGQRVEVSGQGTFRLNGGTATFSDIFFAVSTNSGVWVTGGQLVVTNQSLIIGSSTSGQMTISNGTVLCTNVFVPDLNRGTLTIAGGTNLLTSSLTIGNNANSTGAVWVTGGTAKLVVTNSTTTVGNSGVGQLAVSNGTVNVADLIIARNPGSAGTLTVAGGTMTLDSLIVTNPNGRVVFNSGNLTITNSTRVLNGLAFSVGENAPGAAIMDLIGGTHQFTNAFIVGQNTTGQVWLTGSQLVVTNAAMFVGISQGGGQMTLSNATVLGREALIGSSGGAGVGTLTSVNSTIKLSSFLELGTFEDFGGDKGTFWLKGGQLTVTNDVTRIANRGIGAFIVSNGTWQAEGVIVGNAAGSRGTLTIAGGTNVLSSFLSIGVQAGSTGAVSVTGGQLVVTNASTTIGSMGIGRMSVSNGVWLADVVGVAVLMGSRGTLTIAGGTTTFLGGFDLGTNPTADGTLWMTAGQLVATNSGEARIGSIGTGRLVVSNGVLRLGNAFLGRLAGGSGSLTVAGGTTTVASGLTVGNFACTSTGIVTITGGSLLVTNPAGTAVLEVLSGTFTASGGSVKIDKLVLTNACGRFIHTGGSVSATSTNLALSLDTDGDGFTNQEELSAGTDPFNPASFPSPVTSWIDGSSKWEVSTNWTAGAPAIFNQAVFVTNAASKTVTIDATTSGSFPGTMTISNLTVSSPPGTTNTLSLQNSGTATALRVLENSFIGNVTVMNGVFQPRELFIGNPSSTDVGTLTVAAGGVVSLPGSFNGMIVGGNGGTGAVWLTGGQIVTTNTDISIGGLFSPARGQMTVSNGMLVAGRVFVGGQGGGNGMFTIAGGTNIVANNLRVASTTSATGSVWLTGGLLVSSNGTTFVGDAGVGSMTVSNGTALIDAMMVAGNSGGVGTFTVAGGTARIGSFGLAIANISSTGAVWVTGGTLVSTNAEAASGNLIVGFTGTGRLTLSNGTINAGTVRVAPLGSSPGTLTVVGGTFTADRLEALDPSRTRVEFLGGTTTLRGSDITNDIPVGSAGRTAVLNFPVGTNNISGDISVAGEVGSTGQVWLTGGQLISPIGGLFAGLRGVGQMTVSNGLWRAFEVFVGTEAGSQGTLTLAGGTNVFSSFLKVGSAAGSTGAVWLTGGQLTVTNNLTFVGNAGIGQMIVSNGTWLAEGVSVGSELGSKGTLTIAGGTNSVFALSAGGSTGVTGTVWVTGGQVTVFGDGAFIGGSGVGQLTVSNGIFRATAMNLPDRAGGRGTFVVAGGTNTIFSILQVGLFNCNRTGIVTVTGGSLFVTNAAGNATLDLESGTLTVSGGLLKVDKIVITNACAHFVRTGGTFIYGAAVLNPNNDTDGDGFSNQQETNAGTDPLDPFSFAATVTSWTNGTSKWEVSTNWFPDVAPSSSLQAVFVTNATTKTLTIDATTSGSFPGTMTISNLTVANAGGGVNTLRLTNAGTVTPLRILNGLTNSVGGSILVSNSVLQVQGVSGGTFINNGALTIVGGGLVSNTVLLTVGSSANTTGTVLLAGGRLVATNQATVLGNPGVAQMAVSNGSWQAGNVIVGLNAGSRGTLTFAGGTNSLSGLSVAINSATVSGAVWLTGGQLTITNNPPSVTSIGGAGAGQFTVSNATWETSLTGVGGTMTIAGGNGKAASLGIGSGTGTVWMTGGQYVLSTLLMIGNFGHGRMTMSNGTCQAADISVGRNIGDVGTLTVAGGTMTALSTLILGETDFCLSTGIVTVAGGSLFVTNAFSSAILEVRSGTLTVSSGVLRADKIVITNACAHFARTGGTLQYSSAVLNPNDDTDGDGFTNLQEQNAGSDPLDPTSTPNTVVAPVTSWIDGTGKWEVSTNWSAGAPSITNQAVFVTNAASKTVTINGATPAGNMTISNLTVFGPAGTVNTLQVTNVGLATPLTILDGLTNGSGGNVIVTNSVLEVQGVSGGIFVNNGTLTILGGGVVSNAAVTMSVGSSANTTGSVWVTGGQLVVTNETTSIGDFGVGQMTVSNGMLRAQNVIVGNFDGSQGALTVAGGTNELSSFMSVGDSAAATGAVWVTGGQLTVTNESTIVGSAGIGRMTVSNGTLRAQNVIVGNFDGSQGTLTVAGGTNELSSYLHVGDTAGATGSVWVTGGQLTVTNNRTFVGVMGIGQMTVSNGTWRARNVIVGLNGSSQGTMTVAGGSSSVFSNLTVGNFGCTATGIVAVTGGNLFVTNAAANATLEVRSGTLTISGGSLRADKIVLTNACAHFVRTGGTLIYGTAVLNPAADTDGDGFSNQTEQNAGSDPLDPSSVPTGQLSVNPGTLNFGTISTGTTAQASFVVTNTGAGLLSGSATVTNGPFTILSGSPFNVSANGSTNVVVRFAPVSAGAFTNRVVFNAGAGGISSNTVIGTGAAVPVANFTATPTNGVVPLVVTFTNTSTGTITNDVWNFGDTVTSNTTATVVTHTYNVAGTFSVMLIAQGPVGVSTNSKANLIRALNPPHLVVSPSSRNYGSVTVGQTNTQPFSVINTGDLALTGTVATTLPFAISGPTSYTIQPGQTGTVQVSFIPTGAGVFSNNVVFSSNGGASTNGVAGTGVLAGNIGVNPVALDFGTIATGAVSQRVFVVSNTGGTTVTNGTATVSAPFSIVSGQQFSVPPAGSTNVTVQFAPGSAGAFTGQVVFATTNGGSSTNQVTGTGAVVPVANFTATPTNGAAPLTVTFTNTSTGTITNNVWDFGDTVTSNTTAIVLTHTYTNAGSFGVTLIARGPVGLSTNSKPNLIRALNPPHLVITSASSDFGAVTVGMTNTLPFSVINTGDLALTGTVATASPFQISGTNSFNVPPASTGTVQVSFIPPGAGTFSNSVVFASNGGVSTNGVTGTGVLAGNIGVNPVALDFGTIATGTTSQRVFVVSNSGGTTVTNGTATVSAPFSIVGGQQFSVPPSGSTNVTVQFAPGTTGAFTNPVVFATANGGSSTNSVTGTGAIAPVASFTASPTNGAAPLLVNFTDASTGTITNRLWSFGDTGTSTLASPSHTYSNAGVFSVSLTVFGLGGSNTLNRPTLITVTNVVPGASFTANPTNGAAPLLVFFTDASTGSITNRLWTFGDGATSGGLTPMHTYTTAGVFSVSLTVSGPTGSDTLNRPGLVTVTNVPPMAGFTATPTNGVAPLMVSFADASTGTITNRVWDFGDGDSSTVASPSHTYTNAGSFSVTLTVFGPTGTDSLSRPNLIVVTNAPVTADLEVIKLTSPSPVSVASNLTYTLTVTNRGPDTATSVTLTDVLPASVSFVSASDECTNEAGTVVCDLGSLPGGASTNVIIIVVPTLEGSLTNVASVAAIETDPNPTNNTATAITQVFTVQPPPHDLAVVKLKAPKKIKLSATTPSKVGKFKATLQNLGPQTETIPDLAALTGLVAVEVETLGTNCGSFAASLVPPKKSFPISLAPNKKLNLSYQATFNCANDPLATSKTDPHNDFKTVAMVDLSALGEIDTTASNDTCPRPPSGSDPGCGNKTTAGTLGADVLTDVTIK